MSPQLTNMFPQNAPQIGIGAFWGSRAPSRRPLERPGVPFGRIWGSFWGHVGAIFGAKMTPETVPKKQRFLRMDLGTFWSFWWLNFDRFLTIFGVWRRLSTKKANMCLVSIVVRFRRIFRVHRGQKTTILTKE